MTNKGSEPVKPKRAPRAKKTESDIASKTPKKRGRKPKGGKIVTVTFLRRISLCLLPTSSSI